MNQSPSDYELMLDLVTRGGISYSISSWKDSEKRTGKCIELREGTDAVYIDFFDDGRIVSPSDYD